MLFERVLFSIDFSQESKLLLNCTDEFRSYGMKEAILAHVVDIRSAGGNASELAAFNKEKLDRIKEELKAKKIEAKIAIKIGFPAEELNNIAQKEKASMVLVGSHGGGFIKSLFLGSTVFDLLRITGTPLLIERFKQEEGKLQQYCRLKFPKVLIATDFSKCSAELLKVVGETREIFKQLYLLHVIERAPSKEEFEKLKEDAHSVLQEIKSGMGGGIEIFTYIKVGDAGKKIIETAQMEGITLIMLSKKGSGSIREMLLGSTAQDVASRSTKNAVLIIPC